MAALAVARGGVDMWSGTCSCGHPSGPYKSDPGKPVSVTGLIVGGSGTCTADNLPKARGGVDMILLACGHIVIITKTPSKTLLEPTGYSSVRVSDVVSGNSCGYPIIGVIITGSGTCVAG